jgi:signal transduction histidine kinase
MPAFQQVISHKSKCADDDAGATRHLPRRSRLYGTKHLLSITDQALQHRRPLAGDRRGKAAEVSPTRWVSSLSSIERRRASKGSVGYTYRADDPGLVRAFAILRVAVGLTICIGALFVTADKSDTRLWLVLVAAAWLPLAVVLLILNLRTRSRVVLLVGAVSDLVMLAVAQALLHQGIGFTSGYPIIAAFAAYTCPEVPTWALGGLTLALSLSVQSQLPQNQRFTAAQFGLFAALVVGVLLIVERATTRSQGAERRFVQAKTRADVVLDAVGSAVVVTDSASRVLTANPAADRVLQGEHPLQGQLCQDVLRLHIGERRLDCRDGCQLLALGRSEAARTRSDDPQDGDEPTTDHDFEAWRPGRDGERQPLLVSASPLPAVDGPDDEVVHSIRDISRLKQADEAKTLFLATASHELKTPLTVINGYAKTLTTRSLSPEKQREALVSIRRRGDELARVVDRLLLSSRIEAGRAEVSRSEVDLIPLVYERAAELGEATDRQFEVDLPDDLPPVLGDASALTTVVDHLLDNAVKYSPGGEPVVVRASHDGAGSEGSGDVVLEVTDAGVGMDPETVRHCFEKFWQADASGTRRFGGTGIGLYIVRSLTEAMGGAITVRSELGRGTTFSLRLHAADAGLAIPNPTPVEPTAGQVRRRGRLSRLGRSAEPGAEAVSRDG